MHSFFTSIWCISIIATLYLADQKKLGAWLFFALAVFTGPLAVLIALVLPSKKDPLDVAVPGAHDLHDARRQLGELQRSLGALEARAKNLEMLMGKLAEGGTAIQAFDARNDVVSVKESLPEEIAVADENPVRPADMELDFGRNWLNKIGIAILALGVAFLISYSFQYFGPFVRVAFGYLVGVALFFVGLRLESKEKFMAYGRVLLGGAWAIIYFTTYAMHHFEASRILASEGINSFLLAVVVAGMMVHGVRYRSESMMAVVVGVAYLTLTVGSVTPFTLVSLLLLAAIILFMVYKFQWVNILALGVIVTYGIHGMWVTPQLFSSHEQNLLNLTFLTAYGAVFLAGVHLIKVSTDPVKERVVAATNLRNIVLYSLLSYRLIHLFHDQMFVFFLGTGLVYWLLALWMKQQKQEKMFISDIVAAVSAMTLAIAIKFLPTTALTLWLIEIPFLLFVGVYGKERVYRYLAYALAVGTALKIVLLGLEYPSYIHFLGIVWSWYGCIYFLAAVSAGVCFYWLQRMKQAATPDGVDHLFDQLFSLAAVMYATLWVSTFVREPWVAFALSVAGLVLLVLSFVLDLRRFRAYAWLAMALGAVVLLFDHIAPYNMFLGWFIVSCDVAALFVFYYLIKRITTRPTSVPFLEKEAEVAFFAGLIVLVIAVHQYVAPSLISLGLGVASVVVILAGFFTGNKTERMGGMLLLALTLGRVVLIELSGLDIIFKIITLIVLGVLFLGVSYVYTRFGIDKVGNQDQRACRDI